MTLNSTSLFCKLLVLFSFFTLSLQAQVTCKATAPSQVPNGEYFKYKVVLNEKASKITSVSFPNFDVVNGPSTEMSSSFSMSNGKTTRSETYSYTYTLQAKKEGTFTIPSTVFTVNGKSVKSNSVQVKVVAAGARQNNASQQGGAKFNQKEVLLRASASKSKPYLGEQVVVTYKLYIPPTVNGGFQVSNTTMPSQPNVWSIELGDPNSDATRYAETLNGVRYTVYEVKQHAIFPQKSGSISITPMEMEILCRIIYRQSSGDPFYDRVFGNQRSQDYNLKISSNQLKLEVLPLPEAGKPDAYTDIVGDYTLKTKLSRNELNVNDATNLTLTISGSGNLQHIESLPINFPPDFDVADPQITDKINTKGNSVTGSRSFEYVIIPRNGGEFTIDPIDFAFFNPKSKQYKTLTTELLTLKVEGEASEAITASTTNQKNIKILGNDI